MCPCCPAPMLCRRYVVQGIYCFLEGQAKPTYFPFPASTVCWCPEHAKDPSPLTIWGFTTFTACCTPQLPHLFLLNPDLVLHTDECVTSCAGQKQYPSKAKTLQRQIPLMIIHSELWQCPVLWLCGIPSPLPIILSICAPSAVVMQSCCAAAPSQCGSICCYLLAPVKKQQ